MAAYDSSRRCPCGAGLTYGECCGKYHAGTNAPTAEALMRSRFSAFVTGDEAYLLRTWDPDTRPATLDLADSPVRFYRLDILDTQAGGLLDKSGVVEFEAKSSVAGRVSGSHVRSRKLFSSFRSI